MTKAEFDAAVEQLLVQFQGSLTSGRRTQAHNKIVGGVDGSAHTWGLGADVVWDSPLGDWETIRLVALRLGLQALQEKDHTHFQPLNWVNHPLNV